MDNDNSWSNILYILAIAVLGLIKAFARKKTDKTSAQPVHTEETESKSKDMKDVMETLFGDVFSEESQEMEEDGFEPISEIFVEEPKVEEKRTVEFKPATVVSDKVSSIIEVEEFSEEEESDSDIDFDLRQAVINSEILNRKYC